MRSEGYVPDENARSATTSSPLARREEEVNYMGLLFEDPLWLTYRPDKTAVAGLLDRIRAKPGCSDDFEQQALFRTLHRSNYAFVQVLLNHARVDPNMADEDGYPPLNSASRAGNGVLVQVVLNNARVNPNVADRDGSSSLHGAVRYGDERIVRLLLEDDRVDPNVTEKGGRTPLHLAAYQEKESVVKVLLHDDRVDVIRKDKEGHTPLFYALARRPHPEGNCIWEGKSRVPVIKMLLSAIGKDAAFADKETVFRCAAQQGEEEVLRVLLDDGRFDLTSKDVFGLTPFLWVKAGENQSIVKMLDSSAAEDIAPSDPRLEIAGRCLRFWMNACDEKHGGSCYAKPVAEQLPHEIPAWVVDVSRGCIVPGQQVSRTPGYLQGPVAGRLPTVIRDTMALVKQIGEGYVWIDCLCIVQDDDRTREQIDHMHEVYKGAYLTIIAATHKGLLSKPRVPGRETYEMYSQWHHWSTKDRIQELYRQLLKSTWASRGWTFQEHIMSKRAVIFLDGDIFWDCQLAIWDQHQLFPNNMEEHFLAPHYGIAHRMFKTSWPDFRIYLELIGLYNERYFSYPQDALPAISGLLNLLTNSFPYGFIGGLPRLMLHETLLWQPFKQASRREAKYGGSIPMNGQLPSWSWCGWKCPIDPFSVRTGQAYLNDEESRARVTSWKTSPLVQWHALSEDMHHQHVIHGPTTSVDKPEATLPSGWSRCTDSATSCNSNCSDSLFMHASDKNVRFRRPVLTNEDGLPGPPLQNDWPFLSCVTTQASFRIASLLMPYVYQPPITFLTSDSCSYTGMESVNTLSPFAYTSGMEVFNPCHVICLEDAQGSFAGLHRRMDDRPVIPGDEIELIAISAGSVDYADLQFAFEDNVHRKQECWYPSGSMPFWRVLPGKNYDLFSHHWAPDYQKDLLPPINEDELSGTYHFYNVLWIERKGDIAYRRAAGRVSKDVWDRNCSEPTKIILG